MTAPAQHNCPHSPDGWCLACVGRLTAERDHLRRLVELHDDESEREFAEVMDDSHAGGVNE